MNMPQISQPLTAHLSEDELDDVLIGDGSPRSLGHLSECAACQARTALFESAVANFNQATYSWAEAKSNSIPRQIQAAAKTPGSRMLPAFGSATALCALLLAGHLVSQRSDHAPLSTAPTMAARGATASQAVQASANTADLASDNALLADINAALDQPDSSPLAAYQPGARRPLDISARTVGN